MTVDTPARDRPSEASVMTLILTLTLGAARAALSAPAAGRHRPGWPRRAAHGFAWRARYAAGLPAPDTRYRAAHAARRPGRRASA
jgi:hypothetical protein